MSNTKTPSNPLSDKEILDWLESSDEPFIKIHRLYKITGEKYKGITTCSKQLGPYIEGNNIREALSKLIQNS